MNDDKPFRSGFLEESRPRVAAKPPGTVASPTINMVVR